MLCVLVLSTVCLFCELSLCLRLLLLLLSYDSENDGGSLGYCGDNGERGVRLGDDMGDDRLGEVLPEGWPQDELGTFSVVAVGLQSDSGNVGILANSNLLFSGGNGLNRPMQSNQKFMNKILPHHNLYICTL